MDLKELSDRAAKGLSLYGNSDQPEWVKESAARNSMWSQAYLREFSHSGGILWIILTAVLPLQMYSRCGSKIVPK